MESYVNLLESRVNLWALDEHQCPRDWSNSFLIKSSRCLLFYKHQVFVVFGSSTHQASPSSMHLELATYMRQLRKDGTSSRWVIHVIRSFTPYFLSMFTKWAQICYVTPIQTFGNWDWKSQTSWRETVYNVTCLFLRPIPRSNNASLF